MKMPFNTILATSLAAAILSIAVALPIEPVEASILCLTPNQAVAGLEPPCSAAPGSVLTITGKMFTGNHLTTLYMTWAVLGTGLSVPLKCVTTRPQNDGGGCAVYNAVLPDAACHPRSISGPAPFKSIVRWSLTVAPSPGAVPIGQFQAQCSNATSVPSPARTS
jgi:hypothetical protein